jgi:hypothetical protein
MSTFSERVYVGIRELRDSIAKYIEKAKSGILIIVRDRNKRVQIVVASEQILENLEPVPRLPPEFYSAYFNHPEASQALMTIMARTMPVTAARIVQAAEEFDIKEQRKRNPQPNAEIKRKKVKTEQDERQAIEEGKRIAAAKEKARKEAKKLDELPEGVVISLDSLSIRKKKD